MVTNKLDYYKGLCEILEYENKQLKEQNKNLKEEIDAFGGHLLWWKTQGEIASLKKEIQDLKEQSQLNDDLITFKLILDKCDYKKTLEVFREKNFEKRLFNDNIQH